MKKNIEDVYAEMAEFEKLNHILPDDVTVGRVMKKNGWGKNQSIRVIESFAKKKGLKRITVLNDRSKYEVVWRK